MYLVQGGHRNKVMKIIIAGGPASGKVSSSLIEVHYVKHQLCCVRERNAN